MYKEKLSNLCLETIFIGGGTPSCIDSKYILKILDTVYSNFNISKLNEVTIEVNPGTLNYKKVEDYKNIGINRISLGLQSLDDRILKSIGRIHNAEDFYSSIKLIRGAGFNNINVDIMSGLPNQSIDDLINTIYKVTDLNLEHISLYSLIIEEGTPLFDWYSKGLLQLPDEDTERQMYHKAKEILESKGYIQYEISNFSKPGLKCNHNMTYWRVKPYLGVGLSSHSNLFGNRFWNYSDMSRYNEALNKNIFPIEGIERIDKNMEVAEYCILGLRLNEGILKNEFFKRFDFDIENKYKDIIILHKKNNLLYEDEYSIKLTNKGLDLANIVEVDFMP
jgi:oxygen-independent coproporphyrinogen-3 oxidase